jgi:hypothetical protein
MKNNITGELLALNAAPNNKIQISRMALNARKLEL